MMVAPGGLTGAIGAMSLDGARSVGGAKEAAVTRPAAAPTAAQKPSGGFEAGLIHARAVTSPDKAQNAQTAPNPNLPRGSLIDLKV